MWKNKVLQSVLRTTRCWIISPTWTSIVVNTLAHLRMFGLHRIRFHRDMMLALGVALMVFVGQFQPGAFNLMNVVELCSYLAVCRCKHVHHQNCMVETYVDGTFRTARSECQCCQCTPWFSLDIRSIRACRVPMLFQIGTWTFTPS